MKTILLALTVFGMNAFAGGGPSAKEWTAFRCDDQSQVGWIEWGTYTLWAPQTLPKLSEQMYAKTWKVNGTVTSVDFGVSKFEGGKLTYNVLASFTGNFESAAGTAGVLTFVNGNRPVHCVRTTEVLP